MNGWQTIAPVALVLVANLGCSTTYLPKAGPRLSVGLEGGMPTYFRDGQRFEGGMLGGDIDKAVAGNPAAEEHARTFKTRMRGGYIMMMGALVLLGGSFYTMQQGVIGGDDRTRSTYFQATMGLLSGALVLDIIGLVMVMTAQPHLWDAINIYNDGAASAATPAQPLVSHTPTTFPVLTF